MIDIHKQALDSSQIVLHEFKSRYNRNSNIIYGFVEGKEDPCFYRGFIENNIPSSWKVEIWPSGSKSNVYLIYSKLDWKYFNRNQVLFFVDRDLSDFVNEEKYIKAKNIYITDNYSIENDIVTKNTCDRILREICGFHELKYDESDAILNLFESQLDIFQTTLIPIMSSIIHWRKNNIKASLNNIQMKHIFTIKEGVISVENHHKDNIIYAHERCNITSINESAINIISDAFNRNNNHKKFTRGKYLLWFLIEFCISIHRDYTSIKAISITTQPKMTVNLSQSNGIVQIAPRCKIPSSLKQFLEHKISKYIKSE
ncbi:hypothetical protein EZS27_034750 [termite gut metagenome]|uniref:DUF4435 domain-containing protein n=1 Tax=termite gut metagenome TaxID=433724 RepID=A0A5J4Q0X6_9ZZZZ